MTVYLALLRGINVGGNNIIKMDALRSALETDGLQSVSTFIQSGNVLFVSGSSDTKKLARSIEVCIATRFHMTVPTIVFSRDDWRSIVSSAPKWWGNDEQWKHTLIAVMPPLDTTSAVKAIGELKLDIEKILAGKSVVYQSLSIESFGKTTSGKLASNAIYKQMTIRAYSTTQKLLVKLNDIDDPSSNASK